MAYTESSYGRRHCNIRQQRYVQKLGIFIAIFLARQQSLTEHQCAGKPKARRWDRTFALVDTSFFFFFENLSVQVGLTLASLVRPIEHREQS